VPLFDLAQARTDFIDWWRATAALGGGGRRDSSILVLKTGANDLTMHSGSLEQAVATSHSESRTPEIGTFGLMSRDGKRAVADGPSYRAHPRLYLTRSAEHLQKSGKSSV
jgi:hypothetical protein